MEKTIVCPICRNDTPVANECVSCGAPLKKSPEAKFEPNIWGDGAAPGEAAGSEFRRVLEAENHFPFVFTLVGLSVGFILGCFTYSGSLPLGVVLTRGSFLKGFDQLMIPQAQDSFNHVFWISLFGAAIGVAIPFVLPMLKHSLADVEIGRTSGQPRRPSTQTSSAADELGKLAVLKAQGLLTEEEFKSQKEKILS